MDFSLIGALFSGLMATVVMSLFMEGVAMRRLAAMPNMSLLYGSWLSGDRDVAMVIGNILHFGVVGTLVFGVAYATVLSFFETGSLALGVALGLIHGVAAGIGLGMINRAHPRMTGSIADRPDLSKQAAEVNLIDPGMFGVNWGNAAPVFVMASYLLYGVVFTLMYPFFA